jgi:hypothetical protein
MAFGLYAMHQLGILWPAQIVIGAFVYVLGILGLKVFNPTELAFIKSSLLPASIKEAFEIKKRGNP